MIIGIDFDNTIANYTGVFHQVALALDWIPQKIGRTKTDVKNYFINQNQEAKWTELQGIVYGKEIYQARPYKGCIQVLKELKAQGNMLYLVSHKTRYPIIGEKVDFHRAAIAWLQINDLIGSEQAPFSLDTLFFNETLQSKVNKVAELKCHVFIDDLEKVLLHQDFPSNCTGILFNPLASIANYSTATCWAEVSHLL